jgi:hypothetical protein
LGEGVGEGLVVEGLAGVVVEVAWVEGLGEGVGEGWVEEAVVGWGVMVVVEVAEGWVEG